MKTHISRRTWMVVGVLLAAGGAAELGGRWWAGRQTAGANYSRIEEGLWMGGRVDRPPEGTGAVLNLSAAEDGYRVEAYRWRPIADASPAPGLEWLREQVLFIDEQRRAGRVVYVHCDAGNSRSGMVVAAYVMWRERWGRERALEYLRGKRGTVRLNGAFMEVLGEWEGALMAPGG